MKICVLADILTIKAGTAALRFWCSGDMRPAGNLAATCFEIGRSCTVAGNVLVLGFAFGKISAILGKVSHTPPWAVLLASCGVLRSILGRVGLGWAVVGLSWGRLNWCQVAVMAVSWRQDEMKIRTKNDQFRLSQARLLELRRSVLWSQK